MESIRLWRDMVKVRRHRAEQAERKLARGKCELEAAQLALVEVAAAIDLFNTLGRELWQASRRGDSLALKQLLETQQHMRVLRERVTAAQLKQQVLRIDYTNKENAVGELASAYGKMKNRQDNAEKNRDRYQRTLTKRKTESEEDAVTEQWATRKQRAAIDGY